VGKSTAAILILGGVKMSIFRVHKNKDNPYVMINKTALQDPNISWKAKGLLSYLLSLPDDWQIYESELTNHSRDGRDGTRAAIKELIETGFIHRKRLRDDKGRLKNYEYSVYEVPTQIGKSNVGFPNIGKSPTINTDSTYTNNKDIIMNNGAIEKPNRPSYDLFKKLNSKGHIANLDEPMENVRYFFRQYKKRFKRDHPALKNEQIQQAYERFKGHDEMYCDNGTEIIDRYFDTEFPNWAIDYNLMHFVSGEIIDMRAFEVM
jgi:hypothetical protein